MRRLAVVFLFFAIASPATADFPEGLKAYDAGDYATARMEWERAATKGDRDAMAGLAGLYAGGLGVPRNEASASQWYERAARKGHAAARMNLGDRYARGLGVPRDLIKAYFWLTLAAEAGMDWAAKRRKEIEPLMNPSQVASAESQLRIWKINNP